MSDALLQVSELTKHFPITSGFFSRPEAWVRAVDNINFEVHQGETLGVVGESGCGKTTLVNVLLNLIEPTAGQVIFDGIDLFGCSKKKLRELRQHLQIVFQDPFWSLNPRWLVKDIIGEPLKVHLNLKPGEFIKRVEELLEMVGLPDDAIYKSPHEFSGGQRQRIAIARALGINPKLLVLDEPTSAIDIFSQAQILELLKDLKKRLNLTYILISHDLSVVHHMSDKIMVMYLGEVVEYGPAEAIFNRPAHPYTKALLSAIPDINTESLDEISELEGNVPSAINPPIGCRFNTRCSEVMAVCMEKKPAVSDIGSGHTASCHLL
ncbi:MAG: peptide ABC transporter substrate-binding protein [Desulfobulbaceae bacterium S5133MH15]|nr:MAG: peptide ABC transporter substrate-binding protein [Desulfobulbaceae bacterium S5133MH15]